jgi:pyridoxine 5-phosphate synthase
MNRLRLGVNIDHVATVRNARGGPHPDPVRAALAAQAAGADGITVHLREDRRHIRDADLDRLKQALTIPINLEIACTDEMLEIALRLRPHAVCLVPERREERTTEGGLDVARLHNTIAPIVSALVKAKIRVSLFIEADIEQLDAGADMGAPVAELHTGAYCDAAAAGERASQAALFEALSLAARHGAKRGVEIHAGHGLNFETAATIAAIPEVVELNIGHFLVGEAIFQGLEPTIAKMRAVMDAARGLP